MINRIDQTFKHLKKAGSKALIGYMTAGHPTKASFRTLVPLLESAGLDLLEVGVPFSDPIADGPTIQQSSQMALSNGVTLSWILRMVKELRKDGVKIPLILMSYCNPILSMGIEPFFKAAHESGVDGLIIPDMIPEEGLPFAQAAKRNGVHLIYLAAPTTPKSRLRFIASQTRGFLYAVSLTGVTGVRTALPVKVNELIRSIKSVCKYPVAVGFGLSTPAQVRDVSRLADAVIVGSALIREIEKSKSSRFQGAARFVRSLKGALYDA